MTRTQDGKAPVHVLIVAHRTAAGPALLDAVRERAARDAGNIRFTLVVPNTARGLHRVVDPEDTESRSAREALDQALPLLSEAAGSRVEGILGDPSPITAVADAVNLGAFDEIMVSTLPRSVSRWLRIDLPHKVAGLGLPVTTVTAGAEDRIPVST